MHQFGNVQTNHVLATLLRSGADYLAARARLLERAADERHSEIRFECDRLLREIARRSESTSPTGRTWSAPADAAARIVSGPRTVSDIERAGPIAATERTMSTLTIELRDEHVARLKALAERRGTDIDRLIEQMATVMFAHFDSEARLLAASRDARDIGSPGRHGRLGQTVGGPSAGRLEARGAR